VVSVPLVRSNQPMTASNARRHSREPLACDIPRQGLNAGFRRARDQINSSESVSPPALAERSASAKAHPYRVSDFDDPASDLGCCRRKDIKTRRPAATQMQLSATLKEGQA